MKNCCGVAPQTRAESATPSPARVQQAVHQLLTAALTYIRVEALRPRKNAHVVIARNAFVQTCWSLVDEDVAAWQMLEALVGAPDETGPNSVDRHLLAHEAILALAEMGVLSYEEGPDRYYILLREPPLVLDEELQRAAGQAAVWAARTS